MHKKRTLYRTAGATHQLPGGIEFQIPGTNLTRFEGKSHDQGGILLNEDAEVEGGETKGTVTMAGGNPTDYIFSSYLNMDGTKGYGDGKETIADKSIEVAQQGGDLNQLAKFQEQSAGRSGNRVAREGGPVQYQTEGPIQEPLHQLNESTSISQDDNYWSYFPQPGENQEGSMWGMNQRGAVQYLDDTKLSDYGWILPKNILTSSGSYGNDGSYTFSGPSDEWNQYKNSLDKNDPTQFYQYRAMQNLMVHGTNLHNQTFGHPDDPDKIGKAFIYSASKARDLHDSYQEHLYTTGDKATVFNMDFNGGPVLATKEKLTDNEIEIIRQDRLSNIHAAWPDMNDEEKLIVYNNLQKFSPNDVTAYQQSWFNNIQGDAYQMSKPLYQGFQNSRTEFVNTMELVEDPTQQKIFGKVVDEDVPLYPNNPDFGTQFSANLINQLGLDTRNFSEESIQDFTYSQWLALGMPSSYDELGILPFATMMDGDQLFLENGAPNDEYIISKFNEWRPEGASDLTEQEYVEAGFGKMFRSLGKRLLSAPGAIKYIKKHGWKNYWGGLTKGKSAFKNARTKVWTQHPSSKSYKSRHFKPKVKTPNVYPKTPGGFIHRELFSRDAFLWRHKWKLLFGYEIGKTIWDAGHEMSSFPEVEDTEGYIDEGGDPNFNLNNINIIDINSDGFDQEVLDSMREVGPGMPAYNPGIDTTGFNTNTGVLPEGSQKRLGGPVQYQDEGTTAGQGIYHVGPDGTVYYTDTNSSIAFSSPEDYEKHRASLGLEPDPDFSKLGDPESGERSLSSETYNEDQYVQARATPWDSDVSDGSDTPDPLDRSRIPTTNVASNVYYESDVYGDIAGQQGKQTFEFADGNTIDLYGDEHLFKQISSGGVDAWGTDWFKNANPEVLSKAGITSFSDFSDPTKVLAYQKAWNAANPDNLIREDSYFGEQTTRTGFAADPSKPPSEEDEFTRNWKSPNDWRWMIPVVGAAAQMIGPLKAKKLKPHLVSTVLQPKTSMERVDFNSQLASNTADLNALKTYAQQNIGGPAAMSNIMAGYAAKRRADMTTLSKQSEMNAGIANAEAKINAEILASNAKNVLEANTFNAEALTRTDETKLSAWDAMGSRIGGMAKDWLSYLAERDKARAVAGPEMYNRNLFFARNPHIDPTSDEGARQLEDWRANRRQTTFNLFNRNTV